MSSIFDIQSSLLQEIAYFDSQNNSVGALCTRLSGDAAEIQGATGLRVGLIIQGVFSVVVGFIMGLCYNWKLTLVGTAFLPIVSYIHKYTKNKSAFRTTFSDIRSQF